MRESQPGMIVTIGKLEAEIADLKAEIKSRTTKVNGMMQQVREVAMKIENGYELRPIRCIRFKSYRNRTWICVRTDEDAPGIVAEDEFNEHDHQKSINELIWPGDNGEAIHDWWMREVEAKGIKYGGSKR